MPVVPFLPAIISGVGTVIGAKTAASGQESAAQTQANSADKAAAIQKQMFDEQLAALAPYRAIGSSAVGRLGFGLGLPGYENGTTPTPPVNQADVPNNVASRQMAPGEQSSLVQDALANTLKQGSPIANMSVLRDFNQQREAAAPAQAAATGPGAPNLQPGMVRISYQGKVGYIPQARVQEAIAAGGQVVS